MRLRRLSCTLSFGVLGTLASAVLLAQGQSERPQFRAGVELLQLDVVVLDNKRQAVRGLTAADFTVLDNGVETPIRAFTPIELARPRAPVVMRVRILDAKGTALRDQSLPFPESLFANRRTDCVITLPLSTLAPGEYLLKLDASANRHTSGRDLRFRVE